MNPLAAYPVAHALGWTLLHFCWQGAAVALLLWFVMSALATRSSHIRYAAASIALALMVVLPLATFIRLAVHDYRLAALVHTQVPIEIADIVIGPGTGTAASPWTARLSVTLEYALPWLLAAWCVGVAGFLTRLGLGLFAACMLRATGEAVSAELQSIFDELRARLRMARAVELLCSVRVEVPTVIGWLRPAVLLPASCLSGLAPEQIEAILCHELAHIRRHDYLVSVLQSVVETLLFYHPAVWWVSKQLRRERECCCDEFAVRAGGDRLAYARTLALLEEQRSLTPQLALGANGGVLKMRIQRLLGRPEGPASSQFASIAVLIVLAASAIAVAGRIAWAESHPAQAATAPVQVEAPAQLPTPSIPAGGAPSDQSASREPSAATPSDPETTAPSLQDEQAQAKELEATRNFLTRQLNELKVRLEGQDAAFFALAARQQNVRQVSGDDLRRLEDMRQALEESQNQYNDVLAKLSQVQMAVALDRAQTEQTAKAKMNLSEMQEQLAAAHAALAQESTPPPQPSAPVIVVDVPNPSSGIVRVSAGVMQGLALTQPPPAYPEIAKAAHIQGVVVLHAVISKEGKVEELSVISGPVMLQQSAKEAVQQWTYRPYVLNGQPVAVETNINVNFTFGSEGAAVLGSGIGAGSGPEAPVVLPDGEVLRHIGDGVSPPMVVQSAAPTFSDQARAAKFGGTVLVGLIVDSNGNPQNVHIVRGVGMGLDERALLAVRQYRFRPAMENGKPVPVALNVEVNFKIADGPKPETFSPRTDSAGNSIRAVGGSISQPVLVSQVAPEYTPEARAAKVSGVVQVALIVNTLGEPENVHSVGSEFHGARLDQGILAGMIDNAINAVKQYRFKPAMENGKPVPVVLNVEVNFQAVL